MNDTVKFEWCIGIWKGDQANYILSLANEGIGYFIRKSDGHGKGLVIEAAFRRPLTEVRPNHLELADPYASVKLDKLFSERHGIRKS